MPRKLLNRCGVHERSAATSVHNTMVAVWQVSGRDMPCLPQTSKPMTHPLTHADVGQLDMYVRMYDDLVKDDSDNPTIGILLCTEADKVMAKYSVLNGSEQLFAAKYMAYMPTEEELSREIEQQKRFFLEQHGLCDKN